MTPETVITLGQRALELATLLSAPVLLASLVVGVLISLFQAATQINEMTLSFVPKLLVVVLILLLAGPWTVSYTHLDVYKRQSRYPGTRRTSCAGYQPRIA